MDTDQQLLFHHIETWCNWDETFGADAAPLRAYFSTHVHALHDLLLLLADSRKIRPTRIWLMRVARMCTIIPDHIMRPFLIALATNVAPIVYQSLSNNAYAPPQLGSRTIHPRTPNPTSPHTDYSTPRWYQKDGIWYERLTTDIFRITRKIATGACHALIYFPDPYVRDILTQMITKITTSRSLAAAWTLANFADSDALSRLYRIYVRTTRHKLIVLIDKTLPEIAAKLDLTLDELLDRSVSTHNLDPHGQRMWTIDNYSICLSFTPDSRVQCTISTPQALIARSLSPAFRQAHPEHDQTWRAILAEKQALSTTLSIQKKRLQQAMIAQRTWTYERWQSTFATHPILNYLACRLVWSIQLTPTTSPIYALPDSSGSWYTIDNTTINLSPESTLQLAHPALLSPSVQSAWQQVLIARFITQPFKQLFRPSYLITPAEEQHRTYSTRFASHIVPENRFTSLNETHSWHYTSSFRNSGIYWYDFPTYHIRAYLWCGYRYFANTQAEVLKEIAFYPLNHPTLYSRPRLDLDPACIPLQQVPPIVFSETMYTIDRILVSASLATTDRWHEDDLHYRHYHAHPIDEQTLARQTQQVAQRTEQLLQLLPLLDLPNTVRIQNHNVLIQGHRCTYRIDLNNGTIYIEPLGRYLCIIPGQDRQQLHLPFEDQDPKFSEILSKILLLSNDEQITDKSILRQLPQLTEEQIIDTIILRQLPQPTERN